MKSLDFFWLFIRQIGYASLSLGMILVLIERVIPGFSSLYLHPYFIFVFGLVFVIAASSSIDSFHYSKTRQLVFTSVFLLFSLSLLIAGSFSGFEGIALGLGVAFFVARLYPDEV